MQGAADAYVATIASSPTDRSEATLGAARVLLELERPQDVRILLESFVASAGGRDVAARYLLARAYAALGMWAESAEQYTFYIQSGRPALAYAYLDRANGQLELGQAGAAIASAQAGLALDPPVALRRSLILSIAQSNERAGNLTEAMRWYQNLLGASDVANDDALALSRIAAIKRQLGDATYPDELKRLLAGYPSTQQALTDLNDALARNEPIDPTIRGLIYYRHFDYDKAQPAFQEQITASPNAAASADAYYYLAAIQEARGDPDTAVTNYARAVALNPGGGLADDALWWQARILEDKGRHDEANALFTRIVTEYPASSWAPDAAFRRGILLYGDKDYKAAATLWGDTLATVTDPAQRQRLTFWRGKALLQAGDRDSARPILEQMANQNEDDYFGVRAQAVLKGHDDLPQATRESKIDLAPVLDWIGAESWLAQRTGRAVADPGWSADPRWQRAQELWLVGRSSQGDAEVFDLMGAYASDPIAMYTMARSLQSQGRTGMSARAGQRLLRTLNTNPDEGLPKALLSLSYPPAFATIVERYAAAEKISPLLMLAFMRQESFFDPRAQSPAGALGLTQVLPGTAKTVAARLGLGDVSEERLLAADTNLRLGASYMAQQLKSFDQEIFVAFAAYNAGPDAATRWRKNAGKDADVFLEGIEFGETRTYVENVAENYAIYRYLYAGEPSPDLPE